MFAEMFSIIAHVFIRAGIGVLRARLGKPRGMISGAEARYRGRPDRLFVRIGAEKMTILITGAAGFIGYHTSLALLGRGERVIGVDDLNDYYDVTLKEARLKNLEGEGGFTFHRLDIADREGMEALIGQHGDVTRVIHLAAQAGVRYSLVNPYAYTRTNVEGTWWCSRPAAGWNASSTWSMRPRLPFTAPTTSCPFPPPTGWTGPFPSTPPPRNPWR